MAYNNIEEMAIRIGGTHVFNRKVYDKLLEWKNYIQIDMLFY